MISQRANLPRSTVIALLTVLAVLAAALSAVADPSDTISIIKDGEEGLSTSEIASRLADATFVQADRVLIGRDDEFADAMTSGLLQSDSPLLLVPSLGPVPPDVLTQLQLLDPSEVLLLGGSAAISPAVEAQLSAEGFTVSRTFGPSRIETATEIAQVGAQSSTVLIARAFASDGAGDPTQAFADAMAAGGWSASSGWPILLTETDVLTGSTRDFLAARSFDTAFILGGTAAVGAGVENELRNLVGNVERVAGTDRFGTAIAVAEKVGASTAADVARLTLVDGQNPNSWAGGFAAAAHSAAFNAPIVLTSGDEIPPATAAWLSGSDGSADAGAGAEGVARRAAGVGQDTTTDSDPIRLTCVASAAVCDDARSLLGLPSRVQLRFDPPSESTVTAGDTVSILASGDVEELRIDGSCLDGPVSSAAPAEVQVTTIGECEMTVTPVLRGGTTQNTQAATYLVQPPPPAPRILFQADDIQTDETTGDLYLVDADGTNPQVVAACDLCDDLRLSPDGQTAVAVENGVLALRRAPDFADTTPLIIPTAGESFDDPQFTPDGQSIVATQNLPNSGSVVVRIDLDAPAVEELAPGLRLPGSDAVGLADAVASGVGVLVVDTLDTVGPVSSQLGIVDVEGGDVQILETIPGFLQSASLSPDGSAYALDTGAEEQVAVGFFSTRPNAVTQPGEQLIIQQLLWADDTTVQGLAYNPPLSLSAQGTGNQQTFYQQVDLTVTEVDLTVQRGPLVPDLEDVGRPGLSEGVLIAEVADGLASALTGELITQLVDVSIENPHIIPGVE